MLVLHAIIYIYWVAERIPVTAITANVGTLKRKQQLKDMLQQNSQDYEDDLFDATPFKAAKKSKVGSEGYR